MEKVKEDDVFFVGIEDPVELRRSILESSKDLLQYLQRFENFKEVRIEKQEQLLKLRDTTDEIAKLVRKLKSALPKTHLRAKPLKPEAEEKEEIPEQKKIVIKKKAAEKEARKKPFEAKPLEKPMTDLEKLEAELGAIESRLTKMS